jgi:uncharacterized membrane protein
MCLLLSYPQDRVANKLWGRWFAKKIFIATLLKLIFYQGLEAKGIENTTYIHTYIYIYAIVSNILSWSLIITCIYSK